MAIKLAVGDESFDEIRKTGLYYVGRRLIRSRCSPGLAGSVKRLI